MALVESYFEVTSDAAKVHKPVQCGYRTFNVAGETYLQLDTYGSAERVQAGTISQSIQMDKAAAAELLRLMLGAFPGLRREAGL